MPDSVTTRDDPDLENMEGLILDHAPIIFELPHDKFQVVPGLDISAHHLIKLSVQQDLTQELDRLTFCDIAVGLDEDIVVLLEEHVEVSGEILRHELFVLGQNEPKTVERICADLKARLIDPCKKFPKDSISGGLLRDINIFVDVDCAASRRGLVV
jgi:hypothetical protein